MAGGGGLGGQFGKGRFGGGPDGGPEPAGMGSRFGGGPFGPPQQAGGGGPAMGGPPIPQPSEPLPPGPAGGPAFGGGPAGAPPPTGGFAQPMLGDPNYSPMATGVQPPAPAKLPLSMPAGLPPQPQTANAQNAAQSQRDAFRAQSRFGGAPVNGGGPATVGMSSAADAQKAMMNRAGVKPLMQGGPDGGPVRMKKPAPVSQMPPKPIA